MRASPPIGDEQLQLTCYAQARKDLRARFIEPENVMTAQARKGSGILTVVKTSHPALESSDNGWSESMKITGHVHGNFPLIALRGSA